MVSYFLNTLRFGLRVLIQVALLLLCTAAAQATTVDLAPGLEIPLPTALILGVMEPQPNISLHNTGPVIAGEVAGKPGYFIAATKIKSWGENAVLWKKLETEMRKRNAININITRKGSFITAARNAVWFRGYEYELADQTHNPIYFLLKSEREVYWITLTMTEGVDIDLVIPIAEALIRQARITD
jgi:hypothetical protein